MKHWRSCEVFDHCCKQMRLGWFGCVCGVQLLCVLCQLLSCSMVVVFNCLCCVNCCSVQLSNVSNCCSVQLLCVLCQLLKRSIVVVFYCVCVCSILFLLHMSRFVCNFSSSWHHIPFFAHSQRHTLQKRNNAGVGARLLLRHCRVWRRQCHHHKDPHCKWCPCSLFLC